MVIMACLFICIIEAISIYKIIDKYSDKDNLHRMFKDFISNAPIDQIIIVRYKYFFVFMTLMLMTILSFPNLF